jgi:hypothetical protein
MPDVKEIARHLMREPPERAKIKAILARPEVKEAISAPRKIDRTHDVPYLAGSNKEGGTTYIDKDVPIECKIGDKACDPAKYLNVHEQTEHALMTDGKMPYEDAHSIATQKEREAVEKDGHSWKDYEAVMDGYLDKTEHEKPKNPPPDLYLKPYPHDKQKLMERADAKERRGPEPKHMAVILIHGARE